MQIIDCIQGTDEWFHAKLGCPSASNFDKIITAKCEPSKQREKYLYQLAGEIITGRPHEGFKNTRMEEGNESESASRIIYEFSHGVKVEQVGFCKTDDGLYGCSPDGIIGDYGGFETKDASPHIQAERLHKGWTGSEHHRQVHGCMLVTGRKWWDLVSNCDGMKQVVVRIERDDDLMRKMHEQLVLFCDELKHIVDKIS